MDKEKFSNNILTEINKEFLDKIVKNLPGVIFWKDINSVYRGCNQTLTKVFGVKTREEIIGKTDFDFSWGYEEAERVYNDDQQVMCTKIAKHNIYERVPLVDGGYMDVLTNKEPLLDDNGNVIGILGTATDITELKKIQDDLINAKEKAEQSNLAKSAFLAVMSHELRTPLNGIIGMADILKHTELDTEQVEGIEAIESSGLSLLGLVNDVLDQSMIESGNIILKPCEFSLKELIDNIVMTSRTLATGKGLDFILEYKSDIPEFIFADELRIRQILLNLIGNAVKFTQHGRVSLKIEVEAIDKQQIKLIFSVADTGVGIPINRLETIFEKFVQVESNYNRRYEGVGLGLSIAQRLAMMMNGKIVVKSDVDFGSAFTVSLLVGLIDTKSVTQEKYFERSSSVINFSKHQLRALLVEDNFLNQKIAKTFLKDCGVIVDTASSAEEAFIHYKNTEYDLIFMDLSLPDSDGFSVTKALVSMPQNHGVPIIALTAHVMPEDKQKCFDAGMVEVLTKPLDRSKIIEVLKMVNKEH
jgi:PAS domain S-box-containing protein